MAAFTLARTPTPARRWLVPLPRSAAAALLAMLLVLGADPAAACRCIEPGPATAYRGAVAVVQARVTRVDGDAEGPGGAKVQLAVSRAWKASVGERVEVATRTTCAYVFEPGQEYLVYLQRDAGAGTYLTRRCMGNLPLGEADARLQWLQRNGRAATAALPAAPTASAASAASAASR